MARVDATLLAAQKTGSVTPYVSVEYYTVGRPSDTGGTWTRIDNLSSIERIIPPIEEAEETFGHTVSLYLNNSDSAFDAYDLRDKWVRVGRGIGNNISYPPYLKCYAQDFISSPDGHKDIYVIHCHGIWNILAEYINVEDLYFNQSDLSAALDNKTGKDIIDYILELAGLDLGTSISEDDKIDVWMPVIDMPRNMTGMEMVLYIMSIFRCSLLPRLDNMYLLLTNTGDSYTYSTPQDGTYHPFKKSQIRSFLYQPMKVQVDSIDGSYTGSYADTDWAEGMGYGYWVDMFGVVTSNADCTLIAQAEVERAKSQTESGMVTTYIADCLRELYDTVTITDNRGNTSGSGVVGGIYFYYNPGAKDSEKRFYTEIRLGGLRRAVTDEMQAFIDKFAGSVTKKIPGLQIIERSIPPNALRLASQPFTVDITFDIGHADYTWQQVKWLSGTIIFQDGSEQDIDAGTLNITTSYAGAPDTPVWLYFIQGDSTLHHTQTSATATGRDRGIIAVVQRAEDSSHGKAALFYTGSAGKVGLINATVIACDYLSTITADLGTVTAGVALFLDSGTNWNSWADPDTATGIAIGLSANKGKFEAYNAGTVQVYIDTDGKLKAGAGAVLLDASGITIIDNSDSNIWLSFQNLSKAHCGALFIDVAEDMYLKAEHSVRIASIENSGWVLMRWGTSIGSTRELKLSGDEVFPNQNNTIACGTSSYYWTDMVAVTATLSETTTPTAVTNFGKVYTKSDNKLYFQDGAGSEHEVAFA